MSRHTTRCCIAAAAAALLLPGRGTAVYRTDAFTSSPAASITWNPANKSWTLKNAALRRVVKYDARAGGLAPGDWTGPGDAGAAGCRLLSEGSLTLAPQAAGEQKVLSLDRSWTLESHRAADGALTISLRGYGSNAGFEVDVRYSVMPGNEPVIQKSFVVRQLWAETYLLAEVVYDVFEIPSGSVTRVFTGSGLAVGGRDGGRGLVTDVLAWQGRSVVSDDGKQLRPVWRPFVPVPPDREVRTPACATGLFEGSLAKGAYLMQLHVGRHVSRATPTTVPPLYSTWFGYYNDIREDLVLKLVPKAAALGARIFSVDDGWQGIGDGSRGGYGDWVFQKERFPRGLQPIAKSVRDHGMKFGLWSAPIMAHTDSDVTKQHPETLVKFADGSGKPLWDGTSAHCFTGAYARRFQGRFLQLAGDLGVGFAKVDGGLFVEGCSAEGHDHPAGYSEGAQVAAWESFCEALRRARPGVIISRGWEGEPGLTAIQDTGWFGDWAVAFRPDREADRRWWYRNADIYRRTLYDLTATRPPFTLSWEAPCHVLCRPVDLNALEYHLTSIGAYICNLEIHGRILEMTPEEEALTRKWMKWNWDNRAWLAVAQPLTELGKPYDALDDASAPHVDGVLHLRNALKGRYGYACLWNPADKKADVRFAVRPSDSFVRMDTRTVALRSLRDGRTIEPERSDEALTVSLTMEPLSWEIIEFRKA